MSDWLWQDGEAGSDGEAREIAGLIAFELEPVRPAPTLKARLLERLAVEERPLKSMPSLSGPAAARQRAPGPAGRAPAGRDAQAGARRGAAAGAWAFRLAASVALVATAATIWFGTELTLARREANRLRVALDGVESKLRSEQAARTELARTRDDLRLVTSPTAIVARLEPTGAASLENASGTLFVAADHQHWFLALEGLGPAPAGQVYHLWFIADGRPIAAGPFEARSGERVELRSDTMPENTVAVAISVESEAAGERPVAPATTPILLGQNMVRIG